MNSFHETVEITDEECLRARSPHDWMSLIAPKLHPPLGIIDVRPVAVVDHWLKQVREVTVEYIFPWGQLRLGL